MARGRTGRGAGTPDPIDIRVGANIRNRRNQCRLSQQQLAGKLGITFQQVQKYEHGANRVSASQLHHIAQILDVPEGYFFKDPRAASYEQPTRDAKTLNPLDDPVDNPEVRELVDAFYAIDNRRTRRLFSELAKALAFDNEPNA